MQKDCKNTSRDVDMENLLVQAEALVMFFVVVVLRCLYNLDAFWGKSAYLIIIQLAS